MSFQTLCRLLAAALTIAVAGCASTGATRTETGVQLDLSAKANEGFVVLKVVATRPISILNPKWQSIYLESKAGTKHELNDVTAVYNMLVNEDIPTESLYFARLPAGEYRVTSLGSIGPGPGLLLAALMSDHSAGSKDLPRFAVKAGRLANLGTIAYAPAGEAQPERLLLLNGPQGQRAALEDLLAETNGAQVGLQSEGGWLAPARDDAAMLAQARELASMLSVAKGTPALVAGTHFGQILERKGVANWSRESLDTLGRISAVARLADGTRIAGGNYGVYFVQRRDGAWTRYRLANERGRIIHFEGRADGSVLFIAGDSKSARVHLVPAPDRAAEARVVANVQTPPNRLLVRADQIFFAWNEPGVSRETVITRIDKRSLAVTTQREKFWVMDWQDRFNGEVAISRMNGLSIYRTVSRDNLRTFVLMDTVAPRSVWWLQGDNAYALDYSPGFNSVTNQLQQTADGGKTWTKVGASFVSQPMAAKLLYADAGEIVVDSSNRVLSSTDGGRSWKQVFPAAGAR